MYVFVGVNEMSGATPASIGNISFNAGLKFRYSDGSNQIGDLHAGAFSDYTGYQSVNTPTTIKDLNGNNLRDFQKYSLISANFILLTLVSWPKVALESQLNSLIG